MEQQSFSRRQEYLFYNEALTLNALLIKNPSEWEFDEFIDAHEKTMDNAYQTFREETLDNIILYQDSHSRKAYLNRLTQVTLEKEQELTNRIEALTNSSEAITTIGPTLAVEHSLAIHRLLLLRFFQSQLVSVERAKQTIHGYIQAEFPAEEQDSVRVVADNNKIPWTGTGQEFGAIMNLLIKNGYIKEIKNLKTTVRILHSHFEIKDSRGEEITLKNLYNKCFIERPRFYHSHELKIPKSDNIDLD